MIEPPSAAGNATLFEIIASGPTPSDGEAAAAHLMLLGLAVFTASLLGLGLVAAAVRYCKRKRRTKP